MIICNKCGEELEVALVETDRMYVEPCYNCLVLEYEDGYGAGYYTGLEEGNA